jgi:2-dehydro-3-deoxyphosphogluconate aldolase/(4S)-4-hydroxy-2-oxoglutarate aldolase
MRPSKQTILESVHTTGLMPLFYNADVEVAKHVLETAYRGGAKVFEYANRGTKALEIFKELVSYAASWTDFYIGAGTIMNLSDAQQFVDAGAQFLVSPIFKHEIAEFVKNEDMLWTPGCATMTEIIAATDAGAELIKIFPGSVLGPGFVSSVLPVVPSLKLMPTGGVEPTTDNLKKWFKAGVYCVGMNSHLFSSEDIQTKNWEAIEKKVREALRIISEVRR